MPTRQTKYVLTAEDRTKASFESVKGGLGGIQGAVTRVRTAFVALAAVAVVGGLLRIVKGAAETADEMGKMAQRTGIAVESLSQLKFAAEQNDVPLATLSTGLRTLAVNMLTAAQGSKDQAEAFRLSGIQILDNTGRLRATDTVLLEVADAFSKMADGTTKAALAQRLFGRSGGQLIPFLNQGREGIKALTDEAERLGLTITDSAAKAAVKFNDDLHALGKSVEGISLQFSSALIPDLVRVTTLMRDAGTATNGFSGIAKLLGGALKGVTFGLLGIDALLASIGRGFNAILEAQILVLQGRFGDALDALKTRLVDQFKELQRLIDQRNILFGDPTLQPGTIDTREIPTVGATGLPTDEGEAARLKALAKINKEFAIEQKRVFKEYQAGLLKIAAAQKRLADEQERARDSAKAYIKSLETQTGLMSAGRREREELIDHLALEATGVDKASEEWKKYEEQINRAREFQDDLNTSFLHGADVAFTNYLDEVRDVSLASEDLFRNSFTGIEDALLESAINQKDIWHELAESIIADLLRIQIRAGITGPLASGLQQIGFSLASGSGQVSAGRPEFSTGPGVPAPQQFVPRNFGSGNDSNTKAGPTFFIDARGADTAGLERLERVVKEMNGSIEHRSVAAVATAKARGGGFANLMRR